MSQKPVIIDSPYENSKGNYSEKHMYKGLQMSALPGLHEAIKQLAVKHFLNFGLTLDLGCGSGALALRLSDAGLKMECSDYVNSRYKLGETHPFYQLDLNSYWSQKIDKNFQNITAVEIIEHLENPRHFLREAYMALKPSGRMLVSTPNIENIVSKIFFLKRNHHLWFSNDDYNNQGHITPISPSRMRHFFREAGFKLIYEGTFGNPTRVLKIFPDLKPLYENLNQLDPLPRNLQGEIYFAIIERPD